MSHLTLTPLPSSVAATSLLPNTDPLSGVVTTTVRPTRHLWPIGQDILAALGVRHDLPYSGRQNGEDLRLIHAWFVARNITTLVLRHVTNVLNRDMLDSIHNLTTAANVNLALTCDDTTIDKTIDWVTDRNGTIHDTHQPLLDHLDHITRPTFIEPPGPDWFPRALPHADFYMFRAQCRDLLTPTDFGMVDDLYTATFKNVATNPFTTTDEAAQRLTDLATSDNPGYALTVARAAQAAMFTHGLLLKVHVSRFTRGVENAEHRRLLPHEIHALKCYRSPWRAAAILLRDANLSRDQIKDVRISNVTETGDLTGFDHLPLHPMARTYLHAQRLARIIDGQPPNEPLISHKSRRIAHAHRRAAIDLNLPTVKNQEKSNTQRLNHWKYNLGVSLLPLEAAHLNPPRQSA